MTHHTEHSYKVDVQVLEVFYLSVRAIMTHASVPPEQRKELGIVDNLVRLSVGLEDVDDLIADLDRALLAAKNAATVRVL